MLANIRRDLRVRQLVGRLGFGHVAFELLAESAMFEFPLRFARTKNQEFLGVVHAVDDLVVVLVEVDHLLALTLVFRHEVAGGMGVLPFP